MDITIAEAVDNWVLVTADARTALCRLALGEDNNSFSLTAELWFPNPIAGIGLVSAVTTGTGTMDDMIDYLKGQAREQGKTPTEVYEAFIRAASAGG